MLNLYAKGRCILERWSATTSQRTIAALKAVAPNLPNSCFAPRAESRQYLILSTLHYLARNGPTSNYHRLENWVALDAGVARAEFINPILERLVGDHIDALNENFNRATRVILGLPEGDDPIELQRITANMAEACASFLESLAVEPTASALALSTEIYCLAYVSIAKQGNTTENKLTSICNAITEETGRAVTLS